MAMAFVGSSSAIETGSYIVLACYYIPFNPSEREQDLKLNNLLIAWDGQLKIADFGLARDFADPRSPYFSFKHEDGTDPRSSFSAADIILPRSTCVTWINKTIFRILGTPTEQDWPGHTKLLDYDPIGQFSKTRCQRRHVQPPQPVPGALNHAYFFALPYPSHPSELPECAAQLSAPPLDELDGNTLTGKMNHLKRKVSSPDDTRLRSALARLGRLDFIKPMPAS
ncbi:Cmgc cdk cdk7 protein kinase [Mycena venus]|uniref:Cmgc cdk cdk7 protein kinase n=1 Tax=Mycena venus TaxID=2733690 RepID=A0A8H6YDV9_9AGAR|nr:Cmgc cdk cdk7 protein kinase [Mycena venus]